MIGWGVRGTPSILLLTCLLGSRPHCVGADPGNAEGRAPYISTSIQTNTASIPASVRAGASNASPATVKESVKGVESRPKEDFQLKLQTNASPQAGQATNNPSATNEGFYWGLSWKGWDGLRLEVGQRTSLKSPREMLGLESMTNIPGMHLEQLKMSGKIGGVLELDAAGYHSGGNLDLPNELQLRRARLKVQGDCILIYPVSYKIEIGYIPHRFNLNEAWISSDHIPYLGYLVVGVYRPPMGLDVQTSSRDLMFMEPASPVQALAPANEAGIQIGQPAFNQRATWALGIFGGGVVATEYGNASQNYGNLIGRITWLAVDRIAPPERPAENRLLHLGLSASVQYSASSIVRYQSRPESYLARPVIDTGDIDARGSGTIGFEAAYVDGSLTLQSEFLDSLVRKNDDERLNFHGLYASASWYLTGETRPYDRVNGCFKRLIPRRNFDWGRGGAWGALEIAGRFSYTDLDDGDVRGGRMALVMGELNWYLHSHVRWMFNAGGGHISGGVHDGNLLVFQTRIGVDL